jgi:hypothetical protein
VQTIFAEAQKLRAEAQEREIDLAWKGQATSAKTEQAGPERARVKAEASTGAKEKGKAEAEEAKEEARAARRKEMSPKPAKSQAGKRQRSLFDFDR